MASKTNGGKLGSREWIVFVVSGVDDETYSEILVKAAEANISMLDRFCQTRCNNKKIIRVEIPGVVSQKAREVVHKYF